MAVTLDSSPDQSTYLGLGVEWGLSLDSAGVDPIENRMHYQLIGPGGLVGRRKVSPFVPGGITLDFKETISALFEDGFLNHTSNTVTDIESFISKDFSIRYGQLEFNRDTGVQTELSSTDSPSVSILNISPMYNQGQDFPIIPRWLNTKPEVYTVYNNQYDWVCLRGTGTATIRIYLNEINVSTFSESVSGYKAYPIGGMNFNTLWLPTPKEFTGFSISFNGRTIRVKVKSCQKGDQILFRDPAGGFNSMYFENVQYSSLRESAEYEAYSPFIGSGATRASTPGVNNLRVAGIDRINFKTEIIHGNASGLREYVSALQYSTEHYVITENYQTGSNVLTRFILDNVEVVGGVNQGKAIITASGKISRKNR